MDESQMNPGSQQFTGNTSYSKGLDPSAIKYRLDNEPMLAKIELYLRSAKIIGKQVGDEYIEEMVQVARPLANEEGVQGIMGYLQMTIGAHNVQGNLTWERYDVLIYEINVYLAENIMANLHSWGIKVEDFNVIVDSIMTTIQLFVSRTVENQERISYGQSMMTKEMSVVNGPERKGFFKTLFGSS
jgi:hypothetical protein